MHEVIEKFSIIKALQAIDRAEVVISVLDAHEGVTEQDVSLLGLILERGRSLVVVTNKWDGMSSEDRKHVRDELDRRLPFLDFAERMTISALHGTAVGDVLPAVERAFKAAVIDMSTSDLTRELESAVTAHPPVIVIHGNQTDKTPEAYRRYLINRFRKVFKLKGTPVRLAFKSGKNPFEGKRNKLTPRQEQKRKRLMKHVKK